MRVIALVGPSGTGKSYRAQMVAHEHRAEAIIDDGLLIKDNRIIEGTSAKLQSTMVGAIRAALFSNPEKAAAMRDCLRQLELERLLIIATSAEMARRITRNLEIPEPEKILDIREIASPLEIRRATRSRRQLGHHVVPAPTVEVKPRFSGTLIEPLRSLVRRDKVQTRGRTVPSMWVDQSVVRPTFTYLGRFYIANEAVISIARYVVKRMGYRLHKTEIKSQPEGVTITGSIEVPYGTIIPQAIPEVQARIARDIEYMTALNVLAVNLTVSYLSFSTPDRPAKPARGGVHKNLRGVSRPQ